MLPLNLTKWQAAASMCRALGLANCVIEIDGERRLFDGNKWRDEIEFALLGMPKLTTVDSSRLLSVIHASGLLEDIRVLQETDQVCEMMMKRVGEPPITRSFSIQEASQIMTTAWVDGVRKHTPITERRCWQETPRLMLRAHLASHMCRLLFPDILRETNEPEAPEQSAIPELSFALVSQSFYLLTRGVE